MAALNPVTREVVFKLVFYGPGLGGKTTTLQYIHAATKPEHKGKMVSLSTPTDRTLYFDYLPIRVPRVRGMSVRLQLFTVPGQVHFAATRKLVLSGADGVVFVADSQRGRLNENRESLDDLVSNLGEHNRQLTELPHTFHWNKRDLSDLVSTKELESRFNPHGAPSLETVATKGDGVFEGLERITRLVLTAYEADMPRSDRGGLVANLGAEQDAGIADAIRGLTQGANGHEVKTPASSIPKLSQSDLPEEDTGKYDLRAQTIAPDLNLGAGAPAPPVLGMRAPTPPPPPAAAPPAAAVAAQPASVRFPEREGGTAPGVAPPTTVFSLSPMWPEAERGTVRQTESFLAAGDAINAVLSCDMLVTRVLASAAGLAGSLEAPRDPGLVALLLGLDGSQYLIFRSAVRAARQRQDVTLRDAFDCYVFAMAASRARGALR